MIALGLVLVLSAYLLLRSGFQGTDPRDEILAALRGGKPTKKLASDPVSAPVTDTPPPQSGGPSDGGTRPPPGGSPRGARIISSVAGHKSRPLGNWESDNAIDVVPDPNTGTGTPVKAVAAGSIGLRYGFDPTGGYRLHLIVNGVDKFYYAHFSGYAPGIVPLRRVSKGDVLGYMGDTGNAKGTPHVHLGMNGGDPTPLASELF